MKRICIIDCQTSGISGDKFLAALIDLGANSKRVLDAIKIIPEHYPGCKNLHAEFVENKKMGFKCSQLKLQLDEKDDHRHAHELQSALNRCLEEISISEKGQSFARKVLGVLTETEARLHGEPPEKVHLHETSSADTLVDILGVTIALEDLQLLDGVTWQALPIALGGGTITISHGTVPVPAPATLDLLNQRELLVIGGPIEAELTTPTGASILNVLVDKSIEFLPNMIVEKVGYGAGTKTFEPVPNIMRILLGRLESSPYEDEVVIIETNVDDVSGEVLGYVLNCLMTKGNALDVNMISTITKKNRPGHIIQVISAPQNEEKIIKLLMDETKSLGVRVFPCHRHIWYREIESHPVQIDNNEYSVSFKIARNDKGEIVNIKPEFDEIIKLAQKINKPVKEILDLVRSRINSLNIK